MDVIEHRAPPRRTGMFRSYFDCWRDFISYIDSRVAAFPPGNFHVARLDIRKFYDTVSRPAVNAVLLPAVLDAFAELSDCNSTEESLLCAPLLCPSIRHSAERARFIVDWLADQSFDYELDDPSLVDFADRASGLPQGPDLSAYLANVSLFPLDRALSKVVAELDFQASRDQGHRVNDLNVSGVRGGVYARYVDDMVIVARTSHDLARLRTTVEQQLATIGMELSPKNRSPPSDDRG